MGREVRMVPPNWEHPQEEKYDYLTRQYQNQYMPMYDDDAETAFARWMEKYQEWLNGEHDRVIAKYGETSYPKAEPYRSFCEWHGNPPNPKYYHPKWAEGEATWIQAYATVSEGTPVSPPFATPEELATYLSTYGDFWYQKDMELKRDTFRTKPTYEQAMAFVLGGWAPSAAMIGGQMLDSYQAAGELKTNPENGE
jgi:hypothetical protein